MISFLRIFIVKRFLSLWRDSKRRLRFMNGIGFEYSKVKVNIVCEFNLDDLLIIIE